jgi:hypothetical protein
LAVAPAGYPVLLRLAGRSSSSRHITGAYNVAIAIPFETFFLFKWLCETPGLIVWILEAKRRKSFKKA